MAATPKDPKPLSATSGGDPEDSQEPLDNQQDSNLNALDREIAALSRELDAAEQAAEQADDDQEGTDEQPDTPGDDSPEEDTGDDAPLDLDALEADDTELEPPAESKDTPKASTDEKKGPQGADLQHRIRLTEARREAKREWKSRREAEAQVEALKQQLADAHLRAKANGVDLSVQESELSEEDQYLRDFEEQGQAYADRELNRRREIQRLTQQKPSSIHAEASDEADLAGDEPADSDTAGVPRHWVESGYVKSDLSRAFHSNEKLATWYKRTLEGKPAAWGWATQAETQVNEADHSTPEEYYEALAERAEKLMQDEIARRQAKHKPTAPARSLSGQPGGSNRHTGYDAVMGMSAADQAREINSMSPRQLAEYEKHVFEKVMGA